MTDKSKQPTLTPKQLMARVLFSETKDLDDAIAIANVIKNRLKRSKRFGETLEEVIYAPSQFSGVNSPEWKKVESGKLTPEEQVIYNQMEQVSEGVLINSISDTTGGADHYYNPEIANPSWGKIYPETYKTKYHRYLKEK